MARRKGGKRPERGGPQSTQAGPVADVTEMLGVEALVRPLDDSPEADSQRALLSRAVSKRSAVVVGDRVHCAILEESVGEDGQEGPRLIIERVEARRNALVRPDFHGRAQAIAANLDHVVIVVTPADPPLRLGLVDRYLAACHHFEIDPIICLNKSDLDEDGQARAELTAYERLGVSVVATCATVPGEGLGQLQALLKGRRSLLVGHSGVGKSSLSMALIPGLERRVGEVNAQIGRGRHTTTTASLLALPGGGELVDTPGIRAFGLFGVEPAQLPSLYPEYLELAEGCRFRECSHLHEPGCAVRAAVQEGDLDEGRYERYRQLHASLLEPQR